MEQLQINNNWEKMFWDHYQFMVVRHNSGSSSLYSNIKHEEELTSIIADSFSQLSPRMETSSENFAILYMLYLNTVFEQLAIPLLAEITTDDVSMFAVVCDGLTEDIITAIKIAW